MTVSFLFLLGLWGRIVLESVTSRKFQPRVPPAPSGPSCLLCTTSVATIGGTWLRAVSWFQEKSRGENLGWETSFLCFCFLICGMPPPASFYWELLLDTCCRVGDTVMTHRVPA